MRTYELSHPNTINAVAYARVSKDDKRKVSIEDQFEQIDAYAALRGWSIVARFEDRGVTGQTMERAGLDAARTYLATGKASAIVCYLPDRLGRTDVEALGMIYELEASGIEVNFVKFDRRRSAEGDLELLIHLGIARYTVRRNGESSRTAKLMKARRGVKISGGPLPYAYMESYGINEDQAAIVREIYTRYVHDRESLRAIAIALTDRHIPSPQNGRVWHASAIQRILSDTAYIGTIYYNKRKNVRLPDGKVHVIEREKSEWIAITVPAILDDPSLFHEAQARLQYNKRMNLAIRTTRHEYLLQGLVYCAPPCGRIYYTNTPSNKSYHYYRCEGNVHRWGREIPKTCNSRNVRGDWLEPRIWRAVLHVAAHPEFLTFSLQQMPASDDPDFEQAKMIDQKIKTVEHEQEKLLDLYLENHIKKVLLDKKMAELEREHKALVQQRKDMEAALAHSKAKQELRKFAQTLESRLLALQQEIPTYTFEQKRELLQDFDVQVTINPDGSIHACTLAGIPIPIPE